MCQEGNVNGGDERMIEIQALQDDFVLKKSSSSSGSSRADDAKGQLASIRRCLTLMKEQGLAGGAFTKSIFHHGYDICIAAGDYDGARFYLNSELIAVRDSEGVHSSKAIEIEQVLKDIQDSE